MSKTSKKPKAQSQNRMREYTTGKQPSGDQQDPNNKSDFARKGFGRGALSMIAPVKSLNR